MTPTYDPFHPKYFDEADMREELTRVFDLCHGCRLCFKFCGSFPTLFDYIDQHDDQDAEKLTTAQQDKVVDECFNCKLCYINCPYIPELHEWNLDFPRLMLRAKQVLHETRKQSLKTRTTDAALAHTDLVGRINSGLPARVVNKAIGTPGSALRKVVQSATGISAERVLPPFAKQRFSTWWKKRPAQPADQSQAKAAIFPTCLVEYQEAEIGRDLVSVLEHNNVECSLPEGQVCCGAPYLHQGDIESFRKQAQKNVPVLAQAVRQGYSIVVPQPTCSYVLKFDYPSYIGGGDAKLVSENTFDSSEYLMKLHKGEDTSIDTEFSGQVPANVTYHAPCHLRAQNIGLKSRDLLKLTGAKITVVAECSGIDGTWGLRAENYEESRAVAKKMGNAINRTSPDVIVGDCHLAASSIKTETGTTPQHPIEVIARAYGLKEETK